MSSTSPVPSPTLVPGARVGPYEILGPLGAGGMGEVFRARDPRLGRDVAIKALPAAFAQDPERLARFEREAKVLASLSHPNIAGILGLEEAGGARYLVLEYVDGETLAHRLAGGPLPLDEVLDVGRQVAAGVEAAHENGVVHRDLKPGNIMRTASGAVKVLDFGLARAGTVATDARASASPTMTYAPSEAGLILGTAAYMSPEQARGRAVDKRSDIWSFGCVLYECLTGRQAFTGETVSDTIAAILRSDPDLSALPAATPPRVRELIARCLVRDPRERLRDIGEARITLVHPDERLAAGAGAVPTSRSRSSDLALTIFASILAVVVGVVASKLLSRAPAPAPMALSVMLPRGERLESGIESGLFAIAPDGSSIVYAARSDSTSYRLFLRRLGEREAMELSGTDQGHSPFLSHDGEWVGFFAHSRLKKVSVRGGAPVELAETGSDRAGVWLDDDTIVYSPTFSSGLFRIPAAGGTPVALTTVDSANGERTHRYPLALPGDEWIVFTVGNADSPGDYENASIEAVSLKTGERRKIARGSQARFAPPNHLVIARSGSLLAQRIDPRNPRGGATSVPVFDGVLGRPTAGAAFFDIARNGTLAVVPGRAGREDSHLAWADLSGRLTRVPGEARAWRNLDLSPNGTHVIGEVGPGGGGLSDVFVVDLALGSARQVTFDHQSGTPKWLPDGRHFARDKSMQPMAVVVGDLDGADSGRVLVRSPIPLTLSDVSPDGRDILYSQYGPAEFDVHAVATDGSGPPRTLVGGARGQGQGTISPDGRWVAYASDQSGQREIWIQSIDRPGVRIQVTSRGGMLPLWAPDGRTLYVVSGARVAAVPLRVTADAIVPESPRHLFEMPASHGDGSSRDIDVHPSGTKFLVRVPAEDTSELREIVVMTNWAGTLRAVR